MIEIENEIKRKKAQILLDELTKITSELKSLDNIFIDCQNILKENVIIDTQIYQEEILEKIDVEMKTITNDINNKIIPNLRIENKL